MSIFKEKENAAKVRKCHSGTTKWGQILCENASIHLRSYNFLKLLNKSFAMKYEIEKYSWIRGTLLNKTDYYRVMFCSIFKALVSFRYSIILDYFRTSRVFTNPESDFFFIFFLLRNKFSIEIIKFYLPKFEKILWPHFGLWLVNTHISWTCMTQ